MLLSYQDVFIAEPLLLNLVFCVMDVASSEVT